MIGDILVMACCIGLGYYLGGAKAVPLDHDTLKRFLRDLQD